jgi:hypothetical protein
LSLSEKFHRTFSVKTDELVAQRKAVKPAPASPAVEVSDEEWEQAA